jgi:phage terminase large subunit-like protein
MVIHKTGGIYSALSADAYTKHGLNPSGVLIDETHAHPNRELYDVLTEGTDTARSQQMIFITTTAGIADDTQIGWEIHEYARQVKEGVIDDPTFLPIIYAADQDDDWEDPEVWRKVNPSMDYIFGIDKLQDHYDAVKNNPARQNNFRRYRLNQWVSQITRYIPMDHWDRCADEVKSSELLKRPCYGGIDLSSKIDMSAFGLVFPPISPNEKWKYLVTYYMPEATLYERAKEDRVPYDMWVRAGLIKTTPGNIIDYEFIQKDVVNASKIYDLREVAYDPWNATETAVKLDNEYGINMVEHRQGYVSMSEPTKKLHAHIVEEKLAHGGNKVLRWNADNLEVKIDASENVRPVKANTKKRIDGIITLIMALGRALATFEKKSKYESQGLTVL